MNTLPQREVIEEVAQIKGISEAFIEKDWFVTQIIKIISSITFEDSSIIFSGGTALSKAHGLIQRFSEDIDFKVVAPSLAQLNRTQQSKMLSISELCRIWRNSPQLPADRVFNRCQGSVQIPDSG